MNYYLPGIQELSFQALKPTALYKSKDLLSINIDVNENQVIATLLDDPIPYLGVVGVADLASEKNPDAYSFALLLDPDISEVTYQPLDIIAKFFEEIMPAYIPSVSCIGKTQIDTQPNDTNKQYNHLVAIIFGNQYYRNEHRSALDDINSSIRRLREYDKLYLISAMNVVRWKYSLSKEVENILKMVEELKEADGEDAKLNIYFKMKDHFLQYSTPEEFYQFHPSERESCKKNSDISG